MNAVEAYELHSQRFLRERETSTIGANVVADWSRVLRDGANVIELGCGGGYPITQVLTTAGLQVCGVDSSPSLVAQFRTRFPTIPIQCATVQDTDFFGAKYDGVVAIGLFFLLSAQDQLDLILRLAEILVPGGRFLFTAPEEVGTWLDTCTGVACLSLGRVVYEQRLVDAGLRVVATYTDEGGNHYYDTEKLR
ncbi:MAG: class I SAM-dependent methyltransferase [Burkholderiales bacterium]|nr:class I SAM-dependent methyltransferase [Rhodocyclaceae bacterium]